MVDAGYRVLEGERRGSGSSLRVLSEEALVLCFLVSQL